MSLTERLNTVADIMRHPSNTGRQAQALVDYLRWNLGHRTMGIDYVVPLIEGARLILSKRQNYATLVYTCGLWDFSEQMFLLHLLRPGDTFVDIGANVGGYSILASAVAGANAIAFEPVPHTYAELRRNVRLNDVEARVQTYCCALGELTGVSRMTAARGGLNHIVTGDDAPDTVAVTVNRLDDVLADAPCRMIKLDAEGFELSILRGGARTLAAPDLLAIIVELNGSGGRYGVRDDDVHHEITGHGFAPCAYDPARRSLTPLDGYNRGGLNTIYVRELEAAMAILGAARAFSVRGRSF